jgi:hypothetical protein
VQNIVSGNTMVFNRAAALLIAQCADTDVVADDCWHTS